MAAGQETTTAELDSGEVALIISEDDGTTGVRVVAASDVQAEGSDMAPIAEFALALAKRIRTDPDFQDEVLDWFYAHQDDRESEEDADEDEER